MDTKLTRYNMLLCICLLLWSPLALAQSNNYKEAFELKGYYEFTFAGLAFGKMGIDATQSAKDYAIATDIKSTGLINMFVRHTSHTTVSGAGANFVYPTIDYETHYTTRKKKRYVRLAYREGNLSEEQTIPFDTHGKRPIVPAEMKRDALDPLSFLLHMREELHKTMSEGKTAYSMNVYDGRRLNQADFTILGKQSLDYNGKNTPVIAVDVKRTALAGFTESEMDDLRGGEPNLRMYFSDDARLIPLRLEVKMFGTMAATLVSECATGESCLLGNKE